MTPRVAVSDIPFASSKPSEHWLAAGPREFRQLGEGWYRWTLIQPGIQFEVDRLRWEKHQLIGELTVRCDLAGARTINGELPSSDFNFSSLTARTTRAKYLQERANTKADDIDWLRLVEEFCQQVFQAERTGRPADLLRDLPIPSPDVHFEVDGLSLPRQQPAILFGDGGVAKSLLALYVLGVLAERGIPTLFCDWEFSGEEHRRRIERLFGASHMPEVYYVRCERPLTAEADRLRRIVRERGIQYIALDSVAFACAGPPEGSEAAIDFQRAARSLGVGGQLWTAHVNRSETGDQKPFGSIFWHNAGRSNWNIQRAGESSVGSLVTVALYHRKSNSGRLCGAVGYEIDFSSAGTTIRRVSVADIPEAAAKLPIAERIAGAIRRGPMSVSAIAERIEADADSVRKAVKRNERRFNYRPDASGEKVVSIIERRW